MGVFRQELAGSDHSGLRVWVDLGFVGVDKLLHGADVQLGHRRTKQKKLTDAEKHENYEISRVRIKVEHCIGGMKRYYILRHENRMKKPHENLLFDNCVEMCAGLWNFRKAA
jgi:hypothetical protein